MVETDRPKPQPGVEAGGDDDAANPGGTSGGTRGAPGQADPPKPQPGVEAGGDDDAAKPGDTSGTSSEPADTPPQRPVKHIGKSKVSQPEEPDDTVEYGGGGPRDEPGPVVK
jgi:hypothetical protein